jgi:2-dehydro-3-deoxy-D-gluconate 5-dehydrogenase
MRTASPLRRVLPMTIGLQTKTVPLRDLLDLHGRAAIVTGAAAGIGRAIAERLHEAGAAVVLADLDETEATVAAAGLEARRDSSAIGIGVDVRDPEAVHRVVRTAVAAFGSVDILVNNAGIYPVRPMREMDWDTFRRVIEVNLGGVFLFTQRVAEQMISQGRGGRIVNITSIDALHPSSVGLAHYDASKHGVWGFTKSVALELAEHRIWVNALAPGAIATPGTGFGSGGRTAVPREVLEQTAARIPMHRMGDADEMARAALFLASDMAGYMTGSQLVADGGLLLR